MVHWRNFKGSTWKNKIDVENFIKYNYQEYLGDESFLAGPTDASITLNNLFKNLLVEERLKGGVLDLDTTIPSSIISHQAGYLNKELELIVGLQTDAPLKRGFFPLGGIKVAEKTVESYGYKIPSNVINTYTNVRKTHNQGVFDVYTKEIKKARSAHLITGLPDGYGRGRIIGDYRRVALYGVNALIEAKKQEKLSIEPPFYDDKIKISEELTEQIRALYELIELGRIYGFDLTKPASNAKEAIQWLYFAYLAAVKEQNGAAMSLGRTSTFLDIYLQRDLAEKTITEVEAQELIDQFILKLRMVRFARTPEYNDLFTGDPTWVTESIGGMLKNSSKSLVTKTSFRYLHTLYNLETSAEPNLTILYSKDLPINFRKFCAKVSIETSSIQYENDDLMRPIHGSDYAIACCVSPLVVGKEMQLFGARANLAKALLYAINNGRDEITKEFVSIESGVTKPEKLDFNDIWQKYEIQLDYLAKTYVSALNIIHYMHDKYNYERIEFALHDLHVKRIFATGIAGLSVVADSLSAIKYATVIPIFDDTGLVYDYETTGEFPHFGNNDPRVDELASLVISTFMNKIRKQYSYRQSTKTMSILTITSNVVYGKNTGNTPDGRRLKEPFAPGANPMHGRDNTGALNSLLSVAHLPFCDCQDGISNTFSLIPEALGKNSEDKVSNLVSILDGYFLSGGHHINVNILNRELLQDAYDHPAKYPNLTIRVSGYAVNFALLTNEQKLEVMARTFHER
ncbi:MAG: formate C-acetyltransferase [Acholeplasmatales bacterium]|nr:formate C-acetyltransferase [Acholeplasmatales bacterium]